MKNQDELLMEFCKCETTPERDKLIAEWLEEDPIANQKRLDEIHTIFINTTLSPEKFSDMRRSSRRFSLRRLGLYVSSAAAAVLVLFGAIRLTEQYTRNSLAALTQEVSVPYGQRIIISLSDGTKVWLNSGAKIEYPSVFPRGLRRVYLEGEARFEVAYNAKSPFTVETFVSDIEVLGTTFNVEAEEALGRFSTTLLEGSVKINNRLNPKDAIIMAPNDVVTLSNGRMLLHKIDDPTALLWTEGIISLKGISFEELMSKFEKAYDVKIVLNRKSVPVMEFVSGKIRISDGIEHAMRIVQRGANFKYKRDMESNTITIE